jgi:hypothetical protein
VEQKTAKLIVGTIAPDRRAGTWIILVNVRRSVPWAQVQFVVGVTAMSSATAYVGAVSAHIEQPAPGAESEVVPFPQDLWIVLILSLVLFVLLAWRAIEEAGDDSGHDKGGNWFPPL